MVDPGCGEPALGERLTESVSVSEAGGWRWYTAAMVYRVAWLLGIGWLLASCSSDPAQPANRPQIIERVRMQIGDDPAWASPDFDDRAWPEVLFVDVPGVSEAEGGLVWLRGRAVVTPSQLDSGRALGLGLSALATCTVFWDGEALPAGGRPGATAEAEVPGPIARNLYLPDSLTAAGEHTVAMRCSTHHRGFDPTTGFWLLAFGDLISLASFGIWFSLPAVVSLSGMVIVALYYLALFFLDRRRLPDLLLGAMGLSGAALLVAEVWRNLFGYTYDWHLLRLRLVTFFAWTTAVLLVAFLASRFPGRGRREFVAASLLAATLPVFLCRAWDAKVLALFLGSLSLSCLWSLVALWRRQEGAVLASSGVLCCLGILLVAPLSFGDRYLYLGLDLLLIFLLASHARQVRAASREREKAELRSARLELELLERHLQPHFLMNTLTALTEWVDEDPRTASRMIEELAGELRILGEISRRPSISLEEELRLCRHHLAVMGLRKGCEYRLVTELADNRVEVPPAVFHTLVENALTHNRPSGEEVVLSLRQELRGDRWQYRFCGPYEPGRMGPKPTGVAEGTGLRYVRSRLEESFGSRWRLSHGPEGHAWCTEIELPETTPREGR